MLFQKVKAKLGSQVYFENYFGISLGLLIINNFGQNPLRCPAKLNNLDLGLFSGHVAVPTLAKFRLCIQFRNKLASRQDAKNVFCGAL